MTNISFLFGSGISLKSGYPKMQEITEHILSGEKIGRHYDLNYYLYFQQEINQNYVNNAVSFVNYIKKTINSYYEGLKIDHITNYEDIYYSISQVEDSESLEFENPSLKPFIDDLKNRFKEVITDDFTFKKLLKESLRYIHCIVWQKLNIESSTSEQLNILNEFAKNEDFTNINLLTLNHDILIEHHLQNSAINYNDGFLINSKEIPEWNIDTLYENNDKIKLLKLHGSIDWYKIMDKKNIWNIYKVPTDINVDRIYNIDNTLQLSDGLPIFLIGTFNKMLNYLSSIYEDLYKASLNILNETEYLIISGYSFNDKGINLNLIKWLGSAISKKIIIIHPNFENLRKYTRGAYHIYFDPPQPSPFQNPKLCKIEKRFEDVTYDELLSKINE